MNYDPTNFSTFKSSRIALHSDGPACWSLISTKFPPLSFIDLVTPHKYGGTFLNNYQFTLTECTAAVTALNELTCGANCFFIVPLCGPYGGNEKEMQACGKVIALTMKILGPTALPVELFAVHCACRSPEVIKTYQQLCISTMFAAHGKPEEFLPLEIVSKGTDVETELYTRLGVNKKV
jgi:hypothetical protein